MVKIIRTLKEFTRVRESESSPIGFVPTMGNLHAGHISLLVKGLEEFETVYFSIFVNPKQFGPNEDFNKYPRTLEKDVEKIEAAVPSNKKVIVFAPENPSEVFADQEDVNISVSGLKDILEGEIRPGHFDGVATVVYRLFDLVKPTTAYFGLKDYQQYLVIKKMVKDLSLPVKITGMPIIREASGLAMSSRNQYLSEEEKIEGLSLKRGLEEVAAAIKSNPTKLDVAKSVAAKLLQNKKWNYLEIRDGENLSSDVTHSKKIILLGVYQLRSTRLLDNLEVTLS